MRNNPGGLGLGSEFTLRLPCAAPVTAAADDSAPRPLFARVLMIDDNHDAADSLALLYRRLGAQVEVAYDGASGLRKYAAWRPDVVLLDIGMPGMNGYDVARAIRGDYADPATPIVALTGWGQDDDRELARRAGFDHHLVKPADIGELHQLLGSIAG